MKSFKEFTEEQERIHEQQLALIPEHFKCFGWWGETIWEDLVNSKMASENPNGTAYVPSGDEKYVYVTSNSFVEGINRSGLSVRDTIIDFSLSRIYLLASSESDWLRDYATAFSAFKMEATAGVTEFGGIRWSYSDLVVVSVDPIGYVLTEDHSFPKVVDGYRAVYVTEDIGHNQILSIDSVDDYITKTKLK